MAVPAFSGGIDGAGGLIKGGRAKKKEGGE